MSIVDEMARDAGGESYEAFKFTTIGDTAKGTLIDLPKRLTVPNKFGPGERDVWAFNMNDDDGEPRTLWAEVGKQMIEAIIQAMHDADADFEVGGTLAVRYSEERDTGKGNPMKVYTAAYKPPAPPVASMSPDELT